MESLRLRLNQLASTPLFSNSTHFTSTKQRALLSYQRAKAIASCYSLSIEDITSLTPKFWELTTHPISIMDTAASTLLIIQINLAAGIIAQYADGRSDLLKIVDDLISYKHHGTFLLTEVGHGLDTTNLETTATFTSDGFILHTPRASAAKIMSHILPAGLPCIGIVFARLIVEGEDRGVRPFVVNLNDGKRMFDGVSTKLLPYRGGSDPMNYCISWFNNFRIPIAALLGSIDRSPSPHATFLESIQRVSNGTVATACIGIPMLEICATIGTKYSLRRLIGTPGVSIMRFRTQQAPIMTAVAQAYVLRALRTWVIEQFTDTSQDIRIRSAVATCFKAIMIQHSLGTTTAISERCGTQGLFDYNQMNSFYTTMRGTAIAEGDTLGLSIRLNTDLVLKRYSPPLPRNPESLLARHEFGLLNEQRQALSTTSSHKSEQFNHHILPRSRFMVESIGHRMAYEAAISSGVNLDLIAIYEADAIRQDASWYTTYAGLTRAGISEMYDRAIERLLPQIESLVEDFGVQPYVSAPIYSDASWEKFVGEIRGIGASDTVTEQLVSKL